MMWRPMRSRSEASVSVPVPSFDVAAEMVGELLLRHAQRLQKLLLQDLAWGRWLALHEERKKEKPPVARGLSCFCGVEWTSTELFVSPRHPTRARSSSRSGGWRWWLEHDQRKENAHTGRRLKGSLSPALVPNSSSQQLHRSLRPPCRDADRGATPGRPRGTALACDPPFCPPNRLSSRCSTVLADAFASACPRIS